MPRGSAPVASVLVLAIGAAGAPACGGQSAGDSDGASAGGGGAGHGGDVASATGGTSATGGAGGSSAATGGAGEAGAGVGGGAGWRCPEGLAQGGAEAGMVLVEGPGWTFCIDQTEVTNAQYAVFLAANPPLLGQPDHCWFNETYEAGDWWGAAPMQPVRGVDWCDARAFCAWAGKRLCGRVGGGANPYDEVATLTSEWYVACSAGGTRKYPYGNIYLPHACAHAESPGWYWDKPQQVRTASCEGGYPGLWDMVGNIAEWEDSCRPVAGGAGAGDECRLRGGAYSLPGEELTCARESESARLHGFLQIGFRCCADATMDGER